MYVMRYEHRRGNYFLLDHSAGTLMLCNDSCKKKMPAAYLPAKSIF
jgi:hypothetical protein